MLVEIKWNTTWRNGAIAILRSSAVYDRRRRDRRCLFDYNYNEVRYYYYTADKNLYKKLFMVINHFGELLNKHPPRHRVYEMPEGSAEILSDIIELEWRYPGHTDPILDTIDFASRWEDIASAIDSETLVVKATEAL
jgi:hypothetical protein